MHSSQTADFIGLLLCESARSGRKEVLSSLRQSEDCHTFVRSNFLELITSTWFSMNLTNVLVKGDE
jgi:hypothetical protein